MIIIDPTLGLQNPPQKDSGGINALMGRFNYRLKYFQKELLRLCEKKVKFIFKKKCLINTLKCKGAKMYSLFLNVKLFYSVECNS